MKAQARRDETCAYARQDHVYVPLAKLIQELFRRDFRPGRHEACDLASCPDFRQFKQALYRALGHRITLVLR